jgi:YihY family inner membrane protein
VVGEELVMGLVQRLDHLQRRHAAAGFPIAVVYKFFDDQGSYLAALVTYYGFLSLFPLLLLLSSLLGFALQGDPHLQQQVLSSTLSQFPVIGTQLGSTGLRGSGVGVAVGLVGLVYGGLGVAQAVQNVMNVAWGIPRNSRPNPVMARLRSLLLLTTGGIAVAGTTVLSALGSSAGAFGARLGGGVQVVLIVAAVAVNAVVFLLAFRIATARGLSWRDAAPGALTAAVAWQLLQSFGALYVGHVLKNASAVNGVFGLVLGLFAWLYVAATSMVLSVEINVVRAKRLWPRALLTPFTDDVDLTHGDRKTYSDAAEAQRAKGFESVEVSFDHDGQNASAQRRRAAGGDRPEESATSE